MLQFKSLGKNVLEIKDYIKQSKMNFCDFSLGVKYMWADSVKVEYAIFNDTLIAKESGAFYKNAFYFPIGKDVNGALKEIESYARATNLPLKFSCTDNDVAAYLSERYARVNVYNMRDWCDYIYLAEDMKYFKGKRFSGQRNHLNKFKRLYPNYIFRKIEKTDVERIREFLKEYGGLKDLSKGLARAEYIKTDEFLDVMFDLDQKGGMIEVDGKIVAVSIGEIVGDTLIIHIEKGLRNYEGVYQAMVSSFAQEYATGKVIYINREEDCGDEGLRISKLQYHPIEVKQKNIVEVKTLFDKITLPSPLIITERLTLSKIEETDKKEYAALCLDDERNRLWGYDYRADLEGEADENYFFEFQNKMKEEKEEFSLAVRLDGKLIGEVVMLDFDYYGGLSTGVRIAKEYAGLGFGVEALIGLKGYIKAVIKPKNLSAKCFKENLSSYKMLTKSGYKKTGEDAEYFYFTEPFLKSEEE